MIRGGEPGFGGDHDVASRYPAQRLPQRRFGLAVRVDICGVEEVDAKIEGAVDDFARSISIELGAEGQPGTQSYFAHLQAAAAESSILHGARF